MRLLQQNKFHLWLDKEAASERKVKVTEGFFLKFWVEAADSIKLVRM